MKKFFALFVLSFVWCGQAGAASENQMTQEIKTFKDRDIWSKGFNLRLRSKYKEAITFCDEILKVKSHNPEAYYWKGMALRELERYPESIECFTLAIKYDRDPFKGNPSLLGEVYYQRGQSLEVLGQLEDALSDYEKAIELGFDLRDAYFLRDRVMIKLGIDMSK